MHVMQLFPSLFGRTDIEIILFGCPNPMRSILSGDVLQHGIIRRLKMPHQSAAAAAFPFLLEQRDLSFLKKPHQGMHMLRHDHKAETEPLKLRQHSFEKVDYDSFATVLIQELTPVITGKCQEMCGCNVIDDSTSWTTF